MKWASTMVGERVFRQDQMCELGYNVLMINRTRETPMYQRLLLTGLMLSLSLGLHAEKSETITLRSGEWPPYLSPTLKEAHSGQVDGTLVWRETPERAKRFAFSDVVLEAETVLFHRVDTPIQWTTFEDLAKYRIGGTLGYDYAIENGKGVIIDRVSDDDINFNKLLLGRIDAFPSDKETGYQLLRDRFSEAQQSQITHHATPIEVSSYRVLFSMLNARATKRIQQLNEGLNTLKDSGEYAQILEDQKAGRYVVTP